MTYTERVLVAGRDTTDNSPVVMTSEDLSTWTEVDPWPGARASNVSVAGDAYFVATAASFEVDNYAYSFDGDDWTLNTATPLVTNVTWNGSAFFTSQSNAAQVWTSPTAGGSWTGLGTTGTLGTIRNLAYGAGAIVGCLTSASGDPIFYSTNGGSSWSTHAPASGNTTDVYDVTYGGGRFVAVRPRADGSSSDNVLTSTNGTSWSVVNIGTNDLFFFRVAYGNGIYVAVGNTNIGLNIRTMSSSDAATWTVHTPTGLGSLSGILISAQLTHWAGKFVMVNPNYGSVFTSTDGQTWSEQSFADREWNSVAAGVAARTRAAGWSVGMVRGRRG